MTRNVAIYLFPDVEALDFAGPFEVFTTASRVHRRLEPSLDALFRVFSVAESTGVVQARAGLRITPDFSLRDHPGIDLLIVPGGVIEAQLPKQEVMQWLRDQAATAERVASVCTGAFLLAQAGVVTTQRVTTHWEDQDELARMFPALDVARGPRWVEQGRIFTSAGISAGIDLSLHLVGRLVSPALAIATARQMDYAWIDSESR